MPERFPMTLPLRLARLEDIACAPAGLTEANKEFHVSRSSRGRFQFNHALFSISGNVILADFQAVRLFAQRMNERRETERFPERSVRAGSLNAMGLIDEILHYVVSLYTAQVQPGAFKTFLDELEKNLGISVVRKTLIRFCADFPPQAVYGGHVSAEEYLLGTSKGVLNRETVLEEMLLLWLANVNPAFAPFRELFDDSALGGETAYRDIVDRAESFFSGLPPFGPEDQNLVAMLRSPARAFPDSLSGQLSYIREHWGLLLGRYLDRLLSGQDLIREDEKKYFPGQAPAMVFDAAAAGRDILPADEGERFSQDREWMPRLVLLAKTVYVWLDQLSKKYGRTFATLDQVPDEELDRMAGWGFTGLWLIGIWERSPASRRIKQKCGNPEALASAYSLSRYEVAADLGGEKALQNLKARAWSRGIRLASDMVPNHMGIDSPWVAEHPEWFIALDHSPFPSYTFKGEDISSDPRVSLFIEDHYYDRSDAAVVFKWVDRRSGSVRYIYHGNDGTRMPWNDTAQFNYLRSDVREAVARAIMEVARKFPIIRFDAAMTLTRRHFQRLWFPSPGTGGDIPSRAGQGFSQERFDQAMPTEFWRDIVERMARENPDTLLLAEAFWMMEPYFVRSLGMHRVYNSAFMNFLKMEENAKFRLSLKNALEFNPEILKRYVNFMNNPDEETAAAQFGSGDKYFAACTLMAALPGLPMFGHGQIEGFREKYGMEYRRAYLDESVDEELLRRHERQIFPLLRRRELFSGVRNFLLYDFFLGSGAVDENVIAFSNRYEGERCLVVVHNRHADTAGWIRVSAAFSQEDPDSGQRSLKQLDLGQGLGLHNQPGWFTIFRDAVSGLEYIRPSGELCAQGMFIALHAFQTHVFLDFREQADDPGRRLARLASYLQGHGFASMEAAEREMKFLPLHDALRELCRPEILEKLRSLAHGLPGTREENALWQELEEKTAALMFQAAALAHAGREVGGAAEAAMADLMAWRAVFLPETAPPAGEGTAAKKLLLQTFHSQPESEKLFLVGCLLRRATGIEDEGDTENRQRFGDWRLASVMVGILRDLGVGEALIGPHCLLLEVLCAWAARIRDFAKRLDGEGERTAAAMVELFSDLLDDERIRALLQVNRHHDEVYFSKEGLDLLCQWLRTQVLWELFLAEDGTREDQRPPGEELMELLNYLPALAAQARYRLDPFTAKLARLAG